MLVASTENLSGSIFWIELSIKIPSELKCFAMKSGFIKNAINIDEGVVVKEAILRFQNRETDYPHLVS